MPATQVRKRIQTLALLGPAAALAVLASAKNMSTVAAVGCMTVALAFKSLGARKIECDMSVCKTCTMYHRHTSAEQLPVVYLQVKQGLWPTCLR